jgi:flagellar basal body-associated protein FliL
MADTEETIEDIEGAAEEEAIEAGVPERRMFGPTLVRTLVYIAIALILIIVSGTVAYIVARRVNKAPATEKRSPEERTKPEALSYFELDPFSINTSDTDEPHFIRLSLGLGYKTGISNEMQTELNARKIQLRDIVISVVGEKRYTDLNTQEKRDALKEEIKRRINSVLRQGRIEEVAFTEFVLT